MLYCCVLDVDNEGLWPLLKDLGRSRASQAGREDFQPQCCTAEQSPPPRSTLVLTTNGKFGQLASHILQHFPAQPHHIALYLQSIGNNLESVSAAEVAVNALVYMGPWFGRHPFTNH